MSSEGKPWGGYIGCLVNGTIDVAAVIMYHTHDRGEVTSLGFARQYGRVGLFYQHQNGTESEILSIFDAFSSELWMVVGLTGVLFTLILIEGNPRNAFQTSLQVLQALLGKMF